MFPDKQDGAQVDLEDYLLQEDSTHLPTVGLLACNRSNLGGADRGASENVSMRGWLNVSSLQIRWAGMILIDHSNEKCGHGLAFQLPAQGARVGGPFRLVRVPSG